VGSRSTLGIPVFDHGVAALDVTEVTQPLEEGLPPVGVVGQVGGQVADSINLDRLLSVGAERRGDDAANKRNELTPSHSRLSSTMTRPNYQMIAQGALAIAALRLRVPQWVNFRPLRHLEQASCSGLFLLQERTLCLGHPGRCGAAMVAVSVEFSFRRAMGRM
jgi:hypothetical protein